MKKGIGMASAFRGITRFNFPGKDCSNMATPLYWYPIVGLTLALYSSIFPMLFNYIREKTISTTSLTLSLLEGILITVLLAYGTRGFHLDGLGDTFDGFGGAFEKDKIMIIMKDSRSGVFSVIAISSVLLIKMVGFSLLMFKQPLFILYILMLSRTSLTFLVLISNYAKKEGLAKELVDNSNIKHLLINILFLLGPSIYLIKIGYFFQVFSLFITLISCVIKVRIVSYKKINGITGDVIGATAEIVEAFSLLVIGFSFFI